MKCHFCGEDCYDEKRRNTPRKHHDKHHDNSVGFVRTHDAVFPGGMNKACLFCVVHICPECVEPAEFIVTGYCLDSPTGYYRCPKHGEIGDSEIITGWDYRSREREMSITSFKERCIRLINKVKNSA